MSKKIHIFAISTLTQIICFIIGEVKRVEAKVHQLFLLF